MALAGDHVVVKMDDSAGTLRTFANGDLISVDVPLATDQHDVTGFGDVGHKVINGQQRASVTLRGYLTTTTLVGTHTVIKGAFQTGNQVTFRAAVGNNAAPVVGDPEYSGEFYVESYQPMLETGKAVMFTATLKPAVGTPAPAWGTMA
jgi:hypothetical protein